MMSGTAGSCLVLGSRGFLGSRVIAEFAEAGYAVVGVDRSASVSAPDSSPAGYPHHAIDLPGPGLAALVADVRPDLIVSAAGPASVADSFSDPTADFRGTAGITLGVLDAVREAKASSRVIILSSAAVYGNPASLPVGEGAPLAPVSPYGFHKQIAETLLREYYVAYGVRSCAARIFSAYGPGLKRQVLWDIYRKAVAGTPVTLSGTGEETRDFVHVADVARAVRVLAEKAPMEAEAYNVASGVETSISTLAHTVAENVSADVTVDFSGEQRVGDPLRWQADISAIAALGFAPSIDLAAGVEQYVRWCRDEAGL